MKKMSPARSINANKMFIEQREIVYELIVVDSFQSLNRICLQTCKALIKYLA